MRVVAKNAAVINAQSLKNAVAIQKAVIVYADFRFARGHKLPVEKDLKFGIHLRASLNVPAALLPKPIGNAKMGAARFALCFRGRIPTKVRFP